MIWLLLFVAANAEAKPSPDFLADLDAFKTKSLILRSGREKLSADERTTISRMLQWTPKLSAGVGKSYTRLDAPTPDLSSKSDYGYWRVSADWNLFQGGSDAYSWGAARSNETAQRYEVLSLELQVELAGAKAIFRRLYLRDVEKAQVELLKLKEETIRIGRNRYGQGKISLQEVTKMEVDLSQQQNTVRQSEIDLAENEMVYRLLFVDALRTNEWPMGETQSTALETGGGSLETKRFASLASAASSAYKSVRAQYLPSIDLNASYRNYPLKGPKNDLWSGTLELSIPFWSRFETNAAAAQAHATFIKAENDAIASAKDEELKREFLTKKINLSIANMKDARLNLEKSDQLYRAMLRSFQLGRLSTNELFQEQDRRIRALISYSSSRLSFHESLVEACVLWGLEAWNCLK